MKKTLSVIFAMLMIFTAVMCVPAYAAGIDGTFITEADAKQTVADYLGTTMEDLNKYACSAETVEYVTVGEIIKVTATQYNLSFKYSGVYYKVTVDPVGVIKNFSYNSNKLFVPKGASRIISEAEAKAKAIDAAGISSSDAIFTVSKFVVEDYAAYYTFEFLGKTQQVSAKVNAASKSVAPVLNVTEKNAFVMIFIRLFAKISMLFG